MIASVVHAEALPIVAARVEPLDPAKFRDPLVTATGQIRAHVRLHQLATLWINTGTLCNLACKTCYIESSPTNDALVYLTLGEVESYLEEAKRCGTREIGFTGGEPFMNPDILAMIRTALAREFEVLVLTNAMRPMRRYEDQLFALRIELGARLTMRVSLDHYTQALHEKERGANSWAKALDGCKWLSDRGFATAVAGRALAGEHESAARRGYAGLFAENGLRIDAFDPKALMLFPEMDAVADIPEISEACWDLLGVSPDAVMCASSRMVVKRKGALRPVVVACTLIPYDEKFTLGETLAGSDQPISLNHPHCARFCVLGGASCSN